MRQPLGLNVSRIRQRHKAARRENVQHEMESRPAAACEAAARCRRARHARRLFVRRTEGGTG